jgi:serine/threonine protein kinase
MKERLGKYELIERIGVGGMAEVFLARTFGPKGFKKELCIKRILPHLSANPEFIAMFIDEATLAAKLQHTNIVQIFEFNKIKDEYYIAMEYIDGKNLKEVIKVSQDKGLPLSISQGIYIIGEVLKALHYAHTKKEGEKELGIIHRDVSPHNILISFAGEVKLTDFGIAKAKTHASLTQNGVLKGKCAYMSPEQAKGERIDHRSDLFSVGIILFELITRKKLFQGDTELEILAKVQRGIIPSLNKIASHISPELQKIITKLLDPNPKTRYNSAWDTLSDLTSSKLYFSEALSLSELMKQIFKETQNLEYDPTILIKKREKKEKIPLNLEEKTRAQKRTPPSQKTKPDSSSKTLPITKPTLKEEIAPTLTRLPKSPTHPRLSKRNLFISGGVIIVLMLLISLSLFKSSEQKKKENPNLPQNQKHLPKQKPKKPRSTYETQKPKDPLTLKEKPLKKMAPTQLDEKGFITINAWPWAIIKLKGKTIGQTPLRKYPLTPGKYLITLENKNLKKIKKILVKVRPKKVSNIFHRFELE